MQNQKNAEKYTSVFIEVKLFESTDLITTSAEGDAYSPNNPEDDLGMWS